MNPLLIELSWSGTASLARIFYSHLMIETGLWLFALFIVGAAFMGLAHLVREKMGLGYFTRSGRRERTDANPGKKRKDKLIPDRLNFSQGAFYKDRAIKDNERLLRVFVKHTPAAVAMFDREMRYMAASDRWLQDFQIDEPVIGKSQYELFPDLSNKWREIYRLCLTGIPRKQEEDKFVRSDGETEWIKWEIHPWRMESGEVGGIIIHSELITERKKAEEALKKAKEMAEEASRAKSSFMAKMSHELRTPLTSILGYADILNEEPDLNDEQREQIENIVRSGTHLLEMINDILDVANIESGRIEFSGELFSLRELLENITDNARAKYSDNGNRVTLSLEEGIPDLMVTDQVKLSQIVQQLVDNACKFTEDGEVRVSASYREVGGIGADGMLKVAVRDTGIGIPEKRIKEARKPFTQLREQYNNGTGLGLSIAHRLSRFLGGEFEIESKEGVGTTARVTIPVRVEGSEYGLPDKPTGAAKEIRSEPTVSQVRSFIRKLDEPSRKAICEALEQQDMDRLSNLDESLEVTEELKNGELHKLQDSARNHDYLFITNLYKKLVRE